MNVAAAVLLLATPAVSSSTAFPFSQYNCTLTLREKPLDMGQYVSGDWWVLGPITILSTTPEATAGRNGFEVSPSSIHGQPYDSRAAQYNSSLLPSLPLTVSGGENLVKMISLDGWTGSNPTYVSSAMILTVVSAPPPPGSYRPAYFRANPAAAAKQWTTKQLKWQDYPSLSLPPAPPCPRGHPEECEPPPPLNISVTQRYAMPQIDHLNSYAGSTIHPTINMPGCHYGEAIPQASGLAAVRLLLNDSNAAKAEAAHGLIQYGIDIGAIIAGGGFWRCNGGWQNGRKIVLGLATLVLGETDMSALTAGVPINHDLDFSEDTEITVAPHAKSPGGVVWGSTLLEPSGEAAYWKLVVSGNGERIMADPYGFIDGGAVPGGYYDFCCVYKPWKGEALPQFLSPKLAALINSTEMLTFVKRRYSFGTWTLPDPCAPPTGECSDNSGRCSGWLKSPCGAGGKGKCLLDMKDYGVKFGPNNSTPGLCIAGTGRFPDLHGHNADAGDGYNPFVERMFQSFVKNFTSFSALKIDDEEAAPTTKKINKLRFALSYGSDMVLQAETATSIWGMATPGSTVTLSLDKTASPVPTDDVETVESTTNIAVVADVQVAADGSWKAYLPAQPPSTDFMGHTLTATATSPSSSFTADDSVSLTGIVFGDVWVCSGQSNMDHPMTSIINATTEIAAANDMGASIRLMKVKHVESRDPTTELRELPGLETRWSRASNLTVSNFSAFCFLTGAGLQHVRKYPIGLIDSSWAGVAITPLSSRASCARCGVDGTRGCDSQSKTVPTNATSVYNTMIAPLHSTTIYGILWWQGEASGICPESMLNKTAATYYCLWQSLIQDWRWRWHEGSRSASQVPFGFVQLEPTANPSIRWVETASRVSVPNECLPGVFMAAALDFGDTVAGVHTRYKKPIAERAVLAARAIAYGETGLSYSGPVAQVGSATILDDGKHLSLKFTTTDGLVLKNTAGFQFCSQKNAAECMQWSNSILFTNATSVSLGPTPGEIVLGIPPLIARGGGPPGLIRYAWSALPCNWPNLIDCAVYSKGGLPAPPFMLFIGPESSAPSPLPPCLAPLPRSYALQ